MKFYRFDAAIGDVDIHVATFSAPTFRPAVWQPAPIHFEWIS